MLTSAVNHSLPTPIHARVLTGSPGWKAGPGARYIMEETPMSGRELGYLVVGPLFVLVVGMTLYWALGVHIPQSFPQNPLFKPMAEALSGYAPPVFYGTWIIALGWLVWNLVRWGLNASGYGQMCDRCGGMQVDRNGRYGPYWHCIRCGANQR